MSLYAVGFEDARKDRRRKDFGFFAFLLNCESPAFFASVMRSRPYTWGDLKRWLRGMRLSEYERGYIDGWKSLSRRRWRALQGGERGG